MINRKESHKCTSKHTNLIVKSECRSFLISKNKFKNIQKLFSKIYAKKENIDKTKIPDITIDNMFDRNTRKLSISDNVAQLNYLINNIDEVFDRITELDPLYLVDADHKQFAIDIERDSRFPDKFRAVISNCVDPRVCYEVTIQWVDTTTVKENKQ